MELESLIHEMYVFYLHVGDRYLEIFTPGSIHIGEARAQLY